MTAEIGLNVASLDIDWTPAARSFFFNVSLVNPYQLAQIGYYDNWPVRVWTCYMPTPGDANTFGASELFGGRVAETRMERGLIRFTINSFLDVVNQVVPTNVIELTNTLAAYRGATPPAGLSQVPYFTVVEGSGTRTIYGDCTSPSAHQLFAANVFQFGFLVFTAGALKGV